MASSASISGSFLPRSACTLQTCPLESSHFAYPPSLPSAEAFIAYFAVFLLVHLSLGAWYRTWRLLAGATSFLVLYICGFSAAAWLHADPFSDGWFALYIFALTIAPALLVPSMQYATWQIMAAAETLGPLSIRLRTYRRVSLGLDSLPLLFQIIGAAILGGTSSPSVSQSGADLAVTGLVVEMISLILAIGVCMASEFRILRNDGAHYTAQTEDNSEVTALSHSRMFKAAIPALTCALMSTLACIIIQAKIIAGGREGEVLRMQSLYYGAGTAMATGIMFLSICYPGLSAGKLSKDLFTHNAKDSSADQSA